MPNLWTYEQKFDGLSDGDLNGQDSWSGSTNFQVGAYGAPYEGTKDVLGNKASVIQRAVILVPYGTVYISFYTANGRLDGCMMSLQEGSTDKCRLYFDSTIIIRDPTTWHSIGAWAADTWYRIGFAFDFTAGGWEGLSQGYYKANVNGGAWSTAYQFENPGGSGISNFYIAIYEDAGGVYYWYFDYISPNYSEAGPPPSAGHRFFQMF